MTEHTEHTEQAGQPATSRSGVELTKLVPEGTDALDDLTAAELGTVGRQLRCDPYEAVVGQGAGAGLRWEALARIAWLWAKRRDDRAKLDPYLQLRPAELSIVLGLDDDEPAAAELVEDDGSQDVTENPTAPAHVS